MTNSGKVIIIGAGPVGMTAALALHKRGIPVVVLEQEPSPPKDPRAASLHPTTLDMLGELGITDRIVPLGLISRSYQYHDRPTNSIVAEFNLEQLRDELNYPFVLQFEQYKLTAAIAEQYAGSDDFDVRFLHKVTGLLEAPDAVEVDVMTADGPLRMSSPYVLGCDGGRSTVRKLAEISFEGFSYPERFIKIATHFEFEKAIPNLSYRNYFSDPTEWVSLFKVGGEFNEGLWRCLFPVSPNETDEAAQSPERVQGLLQKFFPRAGGYEIESTSVYGLHQLVASRFRKGRVLLAGDAAHVNNPLGGIGMNSGIHDAVNLAEKLSAVLKGLGAEDMLDLYSRQRRHAAMKYIQAQTIANKKLLDERDETVREKNLNELREVSQNKEKAKSYMRRAALVDSLRDAAAVV